MLNPQRLTVLRELAQRGSFTAAADALSYTQSAVSQQISALERETGALLVERDRKRARMTEAGEILLGHADAILGRIAHAERDLSAYLEARAGRLRLAAGGGVAVQSTVGGGLVEPADELAAALLDDRLVAGVDGVLQPPHERLRGRAPAQVLRPLTGGLANALLLLSDVRHRREKARNGGRADGSSPRRKHGSDGVGVPAADVPSCA